MPSNYVSAYGANLATASTLTVTAGAFAGQKIILDRAAGITVTLPASSGSGNQYEFFVTTSASGGNYVIQVANATDVMQGTALLFADGGDTTVGFATAASSDTITMDGSTRGGLNGARVMVTDIKSGFWHVALVSDASGTEATPFSAAVS